MQVNQLQLGEGLYHWEPTLNKWIQIKRKGVS